MFQTLSETDDFGIHYWQIGRLLGLSPSEIRKIEESYKCNELNKRALEVLRRWKKNYSFSVRVLQSVCEYLEIPLHPLFELLSSSSYMESVNGEKCILIVHNEYFIMLWQMNEFGMYVDPFLFFRLLPCSFKRSLDSYLFNSIQFAFVCSMLKCLLIY